MERQPLVYVLSNGRSGSTLLDGLLGAHPDVFSVGELQVLPHEVREDRAPCACGARVVECAFWGPILPRLPLGLGSGGLADFREHHDRGKLLRGAHLAELLDAAPAARRASDVARYGDATARTIAAVRARCVAMGRREPRWVVDASKDAYRLLWLAASERFEMRVIHLVRDPRAFVHAMTKADGRVSPRRTLRFAGRWAIENALMARLVARALPERAVRRVRYEDLAREPARVLDSIGAWLGLEGLAEVSTTFRSVTQHAIAGGRMRFERGGIRADDAWRERMPRAAARVVGWLTAPVARRLGAG